MQKCSRCMLPANYRAIAFDEEGVCNYCRTYEELRTSLGLWETNSHGPSPRNPIYISAFTIRF